MTAEAAPRFLSILNQSLLLTCFGDHRGQESSNTDIAQHMLELKHAQNTRHTWVGAMEPSLKIKLYTTCVSGN